MAKYDSVIVGGGHNGLVTAAYLARAGRKVLVLERRELVGGCSVTEALELEFADDAVLQEAGEVRGARNTKALPELFGDAATAHQLAPLEDQHLAAGARQVGRGD